MNRILNVAAIVVFVALAIYLSIYDRYTEIFGPYMVMTIGVLMLFSEATKETIYLSKFLWKISQTFSQPKFVGSQAVWGLFLVIMMCAPVMLSKDGKHAEFEVWSATVTSKGFIIFTLGLVSLNISIAIKNTKKGNQPNKAL